MLVNVRVPPPFATASAKLTRAENAMPDASTVNEPPDSGNRSFFFRATFFFLLSDADAGWRWWKISPLAYVRARPQQQQKKIYIIYIYIYIIDAREGYGLVPFRFHFGFALVFMQCVSNCILIIYKTYIKYYFLRNFQLRFLSVKNQVIFRMNETDSRFPEIFLGFDSFWNVRNHRFTFGYGLVSLWFRFGF